MNKKINKKLELIEKMSHLRTIINRVKRRIEVFGEEQAIKDPLFQQAIVNLQEYTQAWNDYTAEELKEADLLFAKFEGTLPDHWKKILSFL